MEIQQLALLLTTQDLNDLARKHFPDDLPVEKLEFQLAPEGVQVTGEFPLFLPVNFTTLWELGIRQGKVTARLANIRAFGLPGTVFKSMVLKLIAENAAKVDGLQCDNDLIILDVERMLAREGVPLRANLQAIRCQAGSILVTAGKPTTASP
jgi:hypothetical protein